MTRLRRLGISPGPGRVRARPCTRFLNTECLPPQYSRPSADLRMLGCHAESNPRTSAPALGLRALLAVRYYHPGNRLRLLPTDNGPQLSLRTRELCPAFAVLPLPASVRVSQAI